MDEKGFGGVPAFPSGLVVVVQKTVIAGELPALIVIHDDEGDWPVGDGVRDPNEDGACGLYRMDHVGEEIGFDGERHVAVWVDNGQVTSVHPEFP